MTMPQRIQRKRTKGWRMPEGAVYVGRGGGWGNPFAVGGGFVTIEQCPMPTAFQRDASRVADAAHAIELYQEWLSAHPVVIATAQRILVGHDLACWCRLVDAEGNRVPCHADVLLELANR